MNEDTTRPSNEAANVRASRRRTGPVFGAVGASEG